MNFKLQFLLALASLTVFTSTSLSQTVEDFDRALITNGVSWKSGTYTYYPSFYTGFAPRVEDPNRIHFHLSRGNQIRLSTQLDEYTVLTYFYNLLKRETLIDQAVAAGLIKLEQQNQTNLFRAVLNSEHFQIRKVADQASNKALSREQLYEQSLTAMEQLNPGRIFHIRLNLTAAIQRWQNTADAFKTASGNTALAEYMAKNPQKTITLLNDLVWGRINAVSLNPALVTKMADTLNSSPSLFESKALELFSVATEGRYNFKVLRNGTLQPSIYQNANGETLLEYPELTAIYPNGSVKDYTSDRDGNKIPIIRETGVMNFISRDTHDVDHIRVEPFYGYIPKMDYTPTGNGIHNPAVRTSLHSSVYKSLYKDLNIPEKDNTLWIVSRGGVSHGCTRMAAGHVLEVREIFPSSNERMKKLRYFGNASQDYDLYDITGSGELQIMGVQYYLAYDIAADSGEGYREGAGLIPSSLNRAAFYEVLYGQKQFRIENNTYVFVNPYISQFVMDKKGKDRGQAFSVKIAGEYNLYEQAYQKDKLQFFSMSSSQMSSLSESNDFKSTGKQLVRLFGRANGCGPFKAEFPLCNEDQFEKEFAALIPQITKVK